MRIVSALALLAFASAGCGSGDKAQRAAVPGVPPSLAQAWEGQATAIASAASAGNSCRALHLATSLRDEVVSSQKRVPYRLRAPLVTGVNSLADRITCTPVVQAPKPPRKPPDNHGHKRKGHDHHGGGDGGNHD